MHSIVVQYQFSASKMADEKRELKEYTVDDVAEHNNTASTWIIMNNKVQFITIHWSVKLVKETCEESQFSVFLFLFFACSHELQMLCLLWLRGSATVPHLHVPHLTSYECCTGISYYVII